MASFNGHKNYNHWNVYTTLANDETLYRMASGIIRDSKNLNEAAMNILKALRDAGTPATPGGTPYTFTTIRAAVAVL